MKKITTLVCVFLVSLLGCGSLNNNFNRHPTGIVVLQQENGTAVRIGPNDGIAPHPAGSIRLCPEFKQPDLPKTPELPLKELLAAGRNLERVEAIERKHIDKLRKYIMDIKKQVTENQIEYLATCTLYVTVRQKGS